MSMSGGPLDRLLRSAAGVPAAPAHPGPFTEARALVAWRAVRPDAGWAAWRRWARISLACTAGISLAAVALAWRASQSDPLEEYSLPTDSGLYAVSMR